MSGIAETLGYLSQTGGAISRRVGQPMPTKLSLLPAFGSNPGNLVAKAFVSDDLAPGSALVVVLHGCTQTADGYDSGAGWSQLAAEAGFALLYPEQLRANNANLCFNWFEAGDVTRGQGEVESVRQMVAAMLAHHDLDPARVFVTGLSAGGAMVSALLAAYPDVFAGGAIIAGLPSGSANGVTEALQRMRSAAPVGSAPLRDAMRAAGGYAGPWPTVSVWHGTGDHIVDPSNGVAIVKQWQAIHGVHRATAIETQADGQIRRVWRDAGGRDVIEYWSIGGMGHGTPLATGGSEACGRVGPHMLKAGISSTWHIARFWKLLPATDQIRRGAAVSVPSIAPARASAAARAGVPARGGGLSPQSKSVRGRVLVPEREPVRSAVDLGPGAVIERALRAAGLMK